MSSRGGGEPTVRASLALLAVMALAAACATAPTWPSYPAVPGVQEVDLAWNPQAGMRLVHRITTDIKASGPLTRPVPEKETKRRIVQTRALDITDVGPEHFDFRVVRDGWPLPATLRFSRAWVPIEVKADEGLGGQDKGAVDAALRQVAEPLTQSAQFFGHWKVGETKPFAIRMSGIPDATGSGRGDMTLRGVVVIDGRRAAEFDWKGSVDFLFTGDPGRGVPGRMTVTGKEWRDLATGASLRLAAKVDAEFTRQGQVTYVEYRTDEALDAAASRL